jgi:membrane fusion protein, multidrug efflux system
MKQIAIAALLTITALSFSACSPDGALAQDAPPASPRPATVAVPITREVAVTQTYPAHVEAVERVELRPRVSGALDRVHFAEGSAVTRGQVLFSIDPRPYAAALAEAEAALAQASADAEASAREGERAARLVEKKAISQEDAERRRASARVSAARVAAARASVESARLNLSFTQVRSPISGRIGRAELTRGNLVSPETRLAVVVATNPVYVRFDVDENTLASHLGKHRGPWRVDFNGMPAEVAFVENEIGGGTGTLRVRARLENPGGAIIPGMYGTATLTLGADKTALLIREEAIGADQGQRFVLAVDTSNVLRYRAVTLGARQGDLRIVTSGLQPNDRIVINGLFRLRPGMPVAPVLSSMEGAATEKRS